VGETDIREDQPDHDLRVGENIRSMHRAELLSDGFFILRTSLRALSHFAARSIVGLTFRVMGIIKLRDY
jgi:hypothetical protein